MTSPKPVVSAILAVYNAEDTVVAALSTLLVQSLPIEIIVVDDGSTDQTKELVKQFPVKLLTQKHQGPALARNLGVKHARSNILLFVDADMTFDLNYVKDLILPIQKNQAIGTFTNNEQVANWDNIWARCQNIQEGWEEKKRSRPNPPKYGTDYRAILKTEFDRVGGFDNIGYTDTWSLFNKLGARPLATQAICYHNNPSTLSAVFRQARWSSKRPYKYGVVGTLYALIRTSLVFSFIVGIIKSILHQNTNFLLFKVVYDFGRFVGILEMSLTGKLSK